MRRILSFVFVLLFSLNTIVAAGNGSGNISNVVNLGGDGQSSTTVLPVGSIGTAYEMICSAEDGAVANGQFYPCVDMTSTGTVGQAQILGGIFYVTSICVTSNVVSVARQVLIGTGTAALGTFPSTATPPAGVVYKASKANTSISSTMLLPLSGVVGLQTCVASNMSFAQNSYPWFQIQNPASANELYSVSMKGIIK